MILSLIAAMAENRVIGDRGRVPWHLPEDLAFFERTTTGHPVLLGRKTWETIQAPLPGRKVTVLSRREGFSAPGVTVARNLEEALAPYRGSRGEVFVAGGGEVYRETLPLADRIYLTVVRGAFPGDVFFPEVPETLFAEVERRKGRSASPPFTITIYARRRP